MKRIVFFGVITDFIQIVFTVFCIFFIPLSEHITLESLVSNRDTKIIVLFLINIVTFAGFIVIFFIEIKRELWLIQHFDYSKKYSSVHLATYKQRYPQLFEDLTDLNWKYYIIYRICKYIYLFNFCFTAIIVFGFYFQSYKTITNFLMSFWFCYSKLNKGCVVAKESLDNSIGYSFYNTVNLSFNRIEMKYKRHVSNSDVIDSLNSSFRSIPGVLELETHL
jgi:hypothetical protein